MEPVSTIWEILPFLVPLFILQVVLLVIALVDLVRRDYVRGGNKIIWLVIIIFVNIIGPVLYLAIGRQERPHGGD